MTWINKDIEKLCRAAVNCRDCSNRTEFAGYIPQPRWIGPLYEKTRPRIMILLLNPGVGKRDDIPKEDVLKNYKNNLASIEDYLVYQRNDMNSWGNGKFMKYYKTLLGLNFDEIAFANIAWCPTIKNKYPMDMLDKCFSKYTAKLINLLSPNIVVLSGKDAWNYENDVATCGNNIIFVKMLHYANRKSNQDNEEHVKNAKTHIEAIVNQQRLTTG